MPAGNPFFYKLVISTQKRFFVLKNRAGITLPGHVQRGRRGLKGALFSEIKKYINKTSC